MFLNENTQRAQGIRAAFVQCLANVEDVGPTLYKIMLYGCFVLAVPTLNIFLQVPIMVTKIITVFFLEINVIHHNVFYSSNNVQLSWL